MPAPTATNIRLVRRARSVTLAASLVLLATVGFEADRVATAASIAPDALSLVGLGDSIPGAPNCDAPCRSYVEVLGELAETTLGRPVTVSNLATNDSLNTDVLLARITTDPDHIEAISDADIITVQVGFNDWQGPCFWTGHEACVAAGADHVAGNLDLILEEIGALRGNAPTAVRVVTYYDHTIGDPATPGAWGFPPADDAAFHEFYASALGSFNQAMCDVAEGRGAACVGLVEAFNGQSGGDDPGDLLGGDHLHPSQSGHELIARTIDELGYAPLGGTPTPSTSMSSVP